MNDVWYTNYKGVSARRHLLFTQVYWGSNEWHKEPQWLVKAFDAKKGEWRDFALKDMVPYDGQDEKEND